MGAFMSSRWLLPEGLVVEGLRREAGVITIAARSPAGDGPCPSCGGRSRGAHSHYLRALTERRVGPRAADQPHGPPLSLHKGRPPGAADLRRAPWRCRRQPPLLVALIISIAWRITRSGFGLGSRRRLGKPASCCP